MTALQESRTAKFGAFQQERAAQPESGWVDAWRKNDGTLRKEIEGAALTPKAREVALADHERFMARSSSQIETAANRQWIERGRTTIEGSVRRQFEAGDYAGGLGALHRAQSVGLFSKAEVSAFTERVEGEQRVRMADGFEADDPFGAQAEFQEAMRTGQSALFPWMGVEEIAQRAEASSKAVLRKQHEVSGGIDAAILSGQVRDEAGVRRMAVEGRLPESEVASLARSLRPPAMDEVGRSVMARDRSYLMTSLENYDPELDADDVGYYGLKQTIREKLPMEERERWLGELETRREKGRDPQSPLKGNIYAQIDRVLDWSQENGKESPREQAGIWQEARGLKERFAEFLKKKPDAKPEEIRQWLSDGLRTKVRLRLASKWEEER